MAVKLRLKRIGRRKRPFYRIVAIDSRRRRDGAEIERLGWYDPLKIDVAVELKEKRIIHWLNQGAQPSETVDNILKKIGLKYKMHLMREGKSDEQIVSLLTEWKLQQEENRTRQLEKKEARKKADAKAKVAEKAESASTAAKVEEQNTENVDKKTVEVIDEPPIEIEEETKEELIEDADEEASEAKSDKSEEVVSEAEAPESEPAEAEEPIEEVSEAKSEKSEESQRKKKKDSEKDSS